MIELQRAQTAVDTPNLEWIVQNTTNIDKHLEATKLVIIPLRSVDHLGDNLWWESFAPRATQPDVPAQSHIPQKTSRTSTPAPQSTLPLRKPSSQIPTTQAPTARSTEQQRWKGKSRAVGLTSDMEVDNEEEGQGQRSKGKGKERAVEVERRTSETRWSQSMIPDIGNGA